MKEFDFAVGGQALIEGVMIRSPRYIAIAVRKPNGSIVLKKERFRSLGEKIPLLKFPFLRGILNLFEMIVTGMRAINYSAEEAIEEEEEAVRKGKETKLQAVVGIMSFALSILLSLALAIFLFKFVPLAITTYLQKNIPALRDHYILFNIIDGSIRIIIFLAYIFLLSRFKTFHRVFEYHGAEHQAVFAYEKKKSLTVESVAEESPCHPRCGTSFIVIVLIISIVIFTMVPQHPDFWLNLGRRIAILPIIASVGYEILKLSGKRQNSALMRAISKPGLLIQKITTAKPDSQQIEVAIAAVKTTLDLEKNHPES